MQTIDFKNFHLAGLSDSRHSDNLNSIAHMIGLDLHSVPGLVKVRQKLVKESGNTIGVAISCAVHCSDGNTYFFSANNTYPDVFKRTSGGVYSNEATLNPPAGNKAAISAMEYNGYIYYRMGSRLGRWQIGTAWSTRNDNFATMGSSFNPTFSPMLIVNKVLYIGDVNSVAQVDDTTFSTNALNLKEDVMIKCFGRLGTDLLIGTSPKDAINGPFINAQIYRWNTWSVSYTNSDPIPEVSINAFLEIDNANIVQAGDNGALYEYDGVRLNLYKKIPNYNESSNKNWVMPNAVANWNGLSLFGYSYKSGSENFAPNYNAIFSIGRHNANYPYILACEVGPSFFETIDRHRGVITTIVPIGLQFLVSWHNSLTQEFGVDIYDLTQKTNTTTLVLNLLSVDRYTLLEYGSMKVAYKQLPTNTAINLACYKNYTGPDSITAVNDTQRNVVEGDINIGEATIIQPYIYFSVNGNNAPEIESIRIEIT